MKQFMTGVIAMMFLMLAGPVSAAQVSTGSGSAAGDEKIEALQEEIIKIMRVEPDTAANANAQAFEDNVNAVKDNQNKMMLNTATRAVAMGQRAVALATTSGKDDMILLKDKIEKAEDLMTVLDGIAELQAQHLQKINQISSLRGKMLELKALEGLMTGDVFAVSGGQEGGQP